MSVELKPVERQTIVIVGATSGIGLATAREAADRGANLVLAARSEDALRELTDELTAAGADATYVVADVRDPDDVARIADEAEAAYGGFDTWVNVAGAFLYGTLEETPVEEMREQFDTNVWGLLQGSLEAADRLKPRGGAIVNLGSLASDRAIPLQGSYSASKHAVKGFTDALRMELEEAGAPVSVTLVKPASVDTPYPEHARSHMDEDARLPPPLYAPETVARAILNAAETPQRDVYVGGASKAISEVGHYAPGLVDTVMETVFTPLQKTDESTSSAAPDNVEEPTGDLDERGSYDGHVSETSLYTQVTQGRLSPRAALAGIAAVVLYLLFGASRGKNEDLIRPDGDADSDR
ncbi:SDR family oxidoreductase [Candidatus Halobonum tyrrellensis]|uniref:Short-chain dehydrogenase/reductase SDR n=1 Tax=Candidatus Halobonum tyrrellensis G22 TaxID=1324957 RepID=V4GXS3_9EURY|nr:SDR family oxidoreductase [Candidatus Halobonum tyrrellensis]ESP89961.1 short-chain dehydrogenase/reductase SDR [Candidatus Halobonum tyrrellensis G22]